VRWLRRSWDAQASLAVTSSVAGLFGAPFLAMPCTAVPIRRCARCDGPTVGERLSRRLLALECLDCGQWSVGS
jgi:hypothetical protein